MISQVCNTIFNTCIKHYHQADSVHAAIKNPHAAESFEHLLYQKNWVDTVQWHLEDIVRNPQINPVEGLALKRSIDASNQVRTDMVEYIDAYFLNKYAVVQTLTTATVNTESPAWAIDRLSILALKIYHMQAEVDRIDADEIHQKNCLVKLNILLEQRKDLSQSIDELITDIANGNKIMKVYKQMKMYNDPLLNPVLYQQATK
jgi:Protein of unknown function (DUF4254)